MKTIKRVGPNIDPLVNPILNDLSEELVLLIDSGTVSHLIRII